MYTQANSCQTGLVQYTPSSYRGESGFVLVFRDVSVADSILELYMLHAFRLPADQLKWC